MVKNYIISTIDFCLRAWLVCLVVAFRILCHHMISVFCAFILLQKGRFFVHSRHPNSEKSIHLQVKPFFFIRVFRACTVKKELAWSDQNPVLELSAHDMCWPFMTCSFTLEFMSTSVQENYWYTHLVRFFTRKRADTFFMRSESIFSSTERDQYRVSIKSVTALFRLVLFEKGKDRVEERKMNEEGQRKEGQRREDDRLILSYIFAHRFLSEIEIGHILCLMECSPETTWCLAAWLFALECNP